MTAITRPATPVPQRAWWQWCQLAGWPLLALALLTLVARIHTPLLWAIAAHVVIDFTLQSDATAAGKAQGRRWVIAYHGFIAGGLPGLIAGGLPGFIIGVLTHVAIDRTAKFGLQGWRGPVADQAAHLLVIALNLVGYGWTLFPAALLTYLARPLVERARRARHTRRAGRALVAHQAARRSWARDKYPPQPFAAADEVFATRGV